MANKYVDISTLKYYLNDVHNLEELLQKKRFEDHDVESLNLFLDSIKDFSDKELFPFVKEMDETPATYKDGTVIVHKQVKTYMEKGAALGIIGATFDYKDGGMQLPQIITHAATYIQEAANNNLPGYTMLTHGSAELIVNFGNEKLKELYVPNMIAGKWQGTMCLTEPQAGSALSAITTKATKTDNDFYKISGQKIFISGGDYQYANNVVHLVLARIEGAPQGTKGISLFVVPKHRYTKDGFENNDVVTIADFQKLGQRGYATTHLGFGADDNCHGWLVGEENKGLGYMFLMMNSARISVGRGASAIATAAYQASLQYANERVQGKKLTNGSGEKTNNEQSLIIEHADVRRMLLSQKAITEGTLSMVFQASKYQDLMETATDKEQKEKYTLLLEILTPITKAYSSEAAIDSINNGVQVLGGYGFCTDFILQQYLRDVRIYSLYEGTTGIQSQDLLGRKVTMQNGKALTLLAVEITASIQKATKYKTLQKYAVDLGDRLKELNTIMQHLLSFAKEGNYERYLADANLFMEYMGIVTMSWLWLDIATKATADLENKNTDYSVAFYESKIHTMKFYYKYELTKTSTLKEILLDKDTLTINKSKDVFV